MNHEQEQQIKNYLKKKNLPLELLLEVEDHFMSQIHHYQSEESLCFDDAFQKTKEIWHQELKLYWDGSSDLEDKCDLLRQYRKTKWKNLVKKTLQYGTALFLLIIFILFLLPSYMKGYVLMSIIITLSLLPLLHRIYYRKEYRLLKKYQIQVTYYQVGILIYTSSIGSYVYFITNFIIKGISFFNDITVKHLLFVTLTIYVFVSIFVSVLFCQVETIKTINRLKIHYS